jgi:hypothetical protein
VTPRRSRRLSQLPPSPPRVVTPTVSPSPSAPTSPVPSVAMSADKQSDSESVKSHANSAHSSNSTQSRDSRGRCIKFTYITYRLSPIFQFQLSNRPPWRGFSVFMQRGRLQQVAQKDPFHLPRDRLLEKMCVISHTQTPLIPSTRSNLCQARVAAGLVK